MQSERNHSDINMMHYSFRSRSELLFGIRSNLMQGLFEHTFESPPFEKVHTIFALIIGEVVDSSNFYIFNDLIENLFKIFSLNHRFVVFSPSTRILESSKVSPFPLHVTEANEHFG